VALERTGMGLKFHPFSWDSVLQDAKTVPAKTRPEGKKKGRCVKKVVGSPAASSKVLTC